MKRVGGRLEKMEGHCSTVQSPQWAVVPVEEEEEELKSAMSRGFFFLQTREQADGRPPATWRQRTVSF